ncbi:hypothetical protein FOA43_000638 [Brettanomyces nanus]|uniref:Anaphase-promoting complex subunit 1 N-terminal domain-containing protein n=1 Tax=Eeniella nana TaxID=13502 RepID=A0A875RXG7_EENNA|nr:uncharacterized protein FOA43_000638 [Brettanomyces nanus]QPG73328.1 hypothetical protein FOA43_000638 [Brettanomyces nanus]
MSARVVCYDMHLDLGSISSRVIDEMFLGRNYKVIVTGPNELLLVQGPCVICTHGTIITRRLNFETDVVDCFYTTFNSVQKGNMMQSKTADFNEHLEKALVVVFKDQIRVYSKKGSSKVVSLPFHIKRAFAYQNGIVINKVPEPAGTAQLSTPTSSSTFFSPEINFLTMLDPLDDPGMIASSSITSFSSKEELISFPAKSSYCLATLFNSLEHTVNVYHVRYLSTSRGSRKKPASYPGIRKSSTRTISSASVGGGNAGKALTPSTNRTADDESKQFRSASTMSYDRMASGSEFVFDANTSQHGVSPLDIQRLHKDIIFTRLNAFSFKADKFHLKIFNVSYQNEEILVVCNTVAKSVEFLTYSNPGNVVSLPTYKSTYSMDGWDAVLFGETSGHAGYVVLLRNPSEIVLFNPFMKSMSPTINLSSRFPPICSLDGCYDSTILIYCEDGKHYKVDLNVKPLHKLVCTLLEAIKYIANSSIYESFWLQWCGNKFLDIPCSDDWKVFVVTLLSSTSLPEMIEKSDSTINRNEITKLLPYSLIARTGNSITAFDSLKGMPGNYLLDSLLPVIVLSIHLIREDLRLNTLTVDSNSKLAVFLAQLASWMGWSEKWCRNYMVDPRFIDRQTRIQMAQPIAVPPNLFQSLSSLFTSTIVPYVTFSQLVEEDESIDELIIPRTFYILRLFEVLISPQFRTEDLIRMMTDYDITRMTLETYPAGIYAILKNKIAVYQKGIKYQWNLDSDELRLIDRKDLFQFEDPDFSKNLLSAQISARNSKNSGAKEMPQILKYVNDNEVLSAWDGQAEADKFHVTRLIFSEDRRFYEVTRLLQTSRVQTAVLKFASSVAENDRLTKQRALGAKIALRTLSMPIGRGAVFFSSRKPLMTEKFPIPKMNFNALILPDMISVSLEKDSVDSYLYDWGYFHNGVSAGLMCSRDFKDISGSWIVFNRPQTLNAQHAGFLLGLGLNGHLKKLEEWHIYNYLGPKHSYTSIGLLLGMAASLRGTMDIKMTKVLSVHVVALLPPGSTDLNVQLPVQTAGIIGIGLLYLGSQHRRMTEMLLSQISSVLNITDKKRVNEGYRLASGVSLGYINLGAGEYLKDNTDTHVIDQLFSLATLIRDIETVEELDKSCGGAIMALMFMFLRTNNLEAAEKLRIPSTRQLLDYVRPDFLMLRCLAYNMIMWDLVDVTPSWVERQIPFCVGDSYSLQTISQLDSDFLPYLNILGGLLLSISVRFASSGNLIAKDTLLRYFDQLMVICSKDPSNYDERNALVGARNIRDVIILGLSIIMSGTGDLEIMRRLRYMQGITDRYTNYGNYMAVNTALGFLFLGGGQHAFKTDDNFSIAALCTSIYPVYATNNYECMSECDEVLLQALRHFWALAVENRCLVVRDIADKQPIKVDVEVERNDTSKLYLDSPCLLPELSSIHKITACNAVGDGINNSGMYEHKKFFTAQFDFQKADKKQCENFLKDLTLFAYERPQYQNLRLDFDSMITLEESKETDMEKQETPASAESLDCFKTLSIFHGLNDYEKNLYFQNIEDEKTLTESSVIDLKLEVEKMLDSDSVDKFWNLKLLFNYVDVVPSKGRKERIQARSRRLSSAKLAEKRFVQTVNNKRKTILDVNMDDDVEHGSDEVDDADEELGYDDTFEGHIYSKRTLHAARNNKGQDSSLNDDMSYLNVKFIERLRNELFRKIKMGEY